jgi:hypothetical protein
MLEAIRREAEARTQAPVEREVRSQAKIARAEFVTLILQLQTAKAELHGRMLAEVEENNRENRERVNRMNESIDRLNQFSPLGRAEPMKDNLSDIEAAFWESVFEKQRDAIDAMIQGAKKNIRTYKWRQIRRWLWHHSVDIFWGFGIFTVVFGQATAGIPFWPYAVIVLAVIYAVQTYLFQPALDRKLRKMAQKDLEADVDDLFVVRAYRESINSLGSDYINKVATSSGTAANPKLPQARRPSA